VPHQQELIHFHRFYSSRRRSLTGFAKDEPYCVPDRLKECNDSSNAKKELWPHDQYAPFSTLADSVRISHVHPTLDIPAGW
jgi:hypothetical protein